jgi:putative redox protein
MMADRTVHTRWTGGMRAVSDVGGFEIVVDEPETHGGTNTGPQPTDLLLASIASCVVLSIAFVARKRGIELLGLDVRTVGTYTGLKFERVSVSISSDTPRDLLQGLIGEAERVCYVSNTLRHRPELIIDVA